MLWQRCISITYTLLYAINMMKRSGAKRDVATARKAIEEMKRTTNFSEFREHWENFLFRIEGAWEYTDRALRNYRGYSQWFQPYATLWKKDPLSVFSRQARNTEMHSVSPTIDKPLELVVLYKSGRVSSCQIQQSPGEPGLCLITHTKFWPNVRKSRLLGGERGIRTLEGLLTLTPLAGERFRPLSHLSGNPPCTGRGRIP